MIIFFSETDGGVRARLPRPALRVDQRPDPRRDHLPAGHRHRLPQELQEDLPEDPSAHVQGLCARLHPPFRPTHGAAGMSKRREAVYFDPPVNRSDHRATKK